MSVENENIEPVTDLGLALGYSSQCIQKRESSDTGAGANAGSRVDMKFVGTDPLSELVYSPQNGLSLKCADSSFVNKKTSLLWAAGPSNMVLSPSQNFIVGRSSIDKPINEENFRISQDTFHLRNETAGANTSGWTPGTDVAVMPESGPSCEYRTGTRCFVEEMNSVVGLLAKNIDEKNDLRNWRGEWIAGPSNIPVAAISEAKDKNISSSLADIGPELAQNGALSGDPTGRGKGVGSGNQKSRMEIVLASEVHYSKECEADGSSVQNLTSLCKRHEKSASFLEKESKNKMTMINSLNVHPLEKLESTSVNDLRTILGKNACGAASKFVGSEFAHEVKHTSQQNEETLPKDKTISGENSPTNSRIQRYRRKSKEKALSDGDVKGRKSKEDDDSHESVESCDSAGLFSTGQKRWSFEQQLIVRSKKAKKQVQENPGSTSFVKQDSSFMNWISNMMKGFTKSNLDEAPSLALTLAHPNHGHESPDQKLITYTKNQDPLCRNVGFQSIFQSLYCRKTKVEERTMDDDYQTELEVVNRVCDISATPLSCHRNNDSLCKQFLLSNEKFNESTLGDGVGLATEPKISPANLFSSQENSKANSAENKNSCSVATGQGEGRTDSNSSIGKRKMSITENIDSEPPSKVKRPHNLIHGSNPLESLWITRFAPKISLPLSNLDDQNQSSGRALQCSFSCQRLIPCSRNPNSSFNDLKIVEAGQLPNEDPPAVVGKELQNSATETEASIGFNRVKSHDDQKSMYKQNPIVPFPRVKNSEAMASIFAKRLDALRHIIPSDSTDNAACATITCFFCGRKGHHLRDCAEITDGELEDLLRSINSYNGAEKLPCLCIRCFQLNHWAVACPSASSRRQIQLQSNEFSPNEMRLNKRNEGSVKLLDGNKCLSQAAGTHTVCVTDDPRKDADLDINRKLKEVATLDGTLCNSLVKEYIASGSGEKNSKDKIMPFSNFIDRSISEVPKGIFDLIKKLRLSRLDILKWMNSHMSLAHLNGFFLRLRLGKWEEGLGGTGYYVACITGMQRESALQYSKNSISVNIGGIKCLVESHYISNHDFLVDELMAWWSATEKRGGKIPLEEELRVKIEERKMLGL